MTLTQLFDLSLRARRDDPALEWGERTLTFGDVDARADRMAGELLARHVRPGDRLAVYLSNGPLLIDLFLACARLGVVFVPVNILYRQRELSHILRDAAPAAIVADRRVWGDLTLDELGAAPNEADGRRVDPVTRLWWGDELERAAADRPAVRGAAWTAADAPAMLVYTSGTTGRAKGAVLTHRHLVANAVALVVSWQITAADRFLLPLPLFHVHGLGNGVHCWLASGCRMRLLDRFDHTTIGDELRTFAPTLFFGVPTMYSRLVELPAALARETGAGARLFVSGSAALAPHVWEAFRERFGHEILERYGMSETLMTISNPYVGVRRAGTIGYPLPGVSARILDEDGQEVGPDAVGELHVKGPTVFESYWRNDAATRAAFTDGFFRTGDLASRDAAGVITLHGRRGDLIISGGFNIYPREIEEVIESHPMIAEAAVAGRSDARRGEVPVAFVVLRPEHIAARLTVAADLDALCRAQLASFKVPRAFVVIDRLPRTALGKVQKALLPHPDQPSQG